MPPSLPHYNPFCWQAPLFRVIVAAPFFSVPRATLGSRLRIIRLAPPPTQLIPKEPFLAIRSPPSQPSSRLPLPPPPRNTPLPYATLLISLRILVAGDSFSTSNIALVFLFTLEANLPLSPNNFFSFPNVLFSQTLLVGLFHSIIHSSQLSPRQLKFFSHFFLMLSPLHLVRPNPQQPRWPARTSVGWLMLFFFVSPNFNMKYPWLLFSPFFLKILK